MPCPWPLFSSENSRLFKEIMYDFIQFRLQSGTMSVFVLELYHFLIKHEPLFRFENFYACYFAHGHIFSINVSLLKALIFFCFEVGNSWAFRICISGLENSHFIVEKCQKIGSDDKELFDQNKSNKTGSEFLFSICK